MYALITGASRGIGKAIAKHFATNGYNLVLVYKNNTSLMEEFCSSLSEHNIICHSFKCDISNFEDVSSLWQKIHNMNISIDILINNAGISHIGLLQDMSDLEWHTVLNTNLSSVFYMCKHAIPYMVSSQKGRIINISSIWGDVGASMEVAYSASKGGVNSFTKALAKELAPSNIAVNAVSFGAIDTDMNAHLSNEERKELEDCIPASRYGTCDECGKLVYDIAHSPIYMTGAIITMDGALI